MYIPDFGKPDALHLPTGWYGGAPCNSCHAAVSGMQLSRASHTDPSMPRTMQRAPHPSDPLHA